MSINLSIFSDFLLTKLIYPHTAVTFCDAPVEYQVNFSEACSPTMEGIISFNGNVLFTISFIGIGVGWILANCIYYYSENNTSQVSSFTHSKELEIVWTSIPAIILLLLATPSFSLLYSMDEIADPTVTLKIIGHQWYWSYEYSDIQTHCLNDSSLEVPSLKYSCYLTALETLPEKQGYFRLLETNRRIVLPANTHLRLLVTSADVLHSWTVPSFGVKVDACPGRLNQLNMFLKRTGLFFGQCSEICGVNHAFMPIALLAIDPVTHEQIMYNHFFEHSAAIFDN